MLKNCPRSIYLPTVMCTAWISAVPARVMIMFAFTVSSPNKSNVSIPKRCHVPAFIQSNSWDTSRLPFYGNSIWFIRAQSKISLNSPTIDNPPFFYLIIFIWNLKCRELIYTHNILFPYSPLPSLIHANIFSWFLYQFIPFPPFSTTSAFPSNESILIFDTYHFIYIFL